MTLEEMRLEALKLAIDELTANPCALFDSSQVVARAGEYYYFLKSGAVPPIERAKPAKKRR